ncbi:MAG: hypothetical protein NVSMB46_02830 [Candidatus Saccharimonadales bacterium]
MNNSMKSLTNKIEPIIHFVKKYLVFSFFVILLVIFGLLIYRINSLTRVEPNDSDVTAKLKTVQRPHIDQQTIDKIQQLQDQNIQVQSLFNQARSNPFSEQ